MCPQEHGSKSKNSERKKSFKLRFFHPAKILSIRGEWRKFQYTKPSIYLPNTPSQVFLKEAFHQNEGRKWERHLVQESEDSMLEKGERDSQNDGEWGLKKCLHKRTGSADYLLYMNIRGKYLKFYLFGDSSVI